MVTDEVLAKKAQTGDRAAFTELVKRYEKRIYSLAWRMTNNRADASDLLQETFLQVWRKLSTWRGEASFATWLYRVAVNNVLMKKRKEKKEKMETFSLDKPFPGDGDGKPRELSDDWSKNPAVTLENKELKSRLEKAIKGLPKDYRSVFYLRDIDGLSTQEVGDILKLSRPAVKSRLHRARIFLRENLADYVMH